MFSAKIKGVAPTQSQMDATLHGSNAPKRVFYNDMQRRQFDNPAPILSPTEHAPAHNYRADLVSSKSLTSVQAQYVNAMATQMLTGKGAAAVKRATWQGKMYSR